MNAMTCSRDLLDKGARRKPSPGPLVPGGPSKSGHPKIAPFLRPGPEVVNESIPVFFVGRNRDGFWVARDTGAKFGGLFWRRQAAIRFAKSSAGPAGCATVFPKARFELDIENTGNPLIGYIGTARRLLSLAGLTGS